MQNLRETDGTPMHRKVVRFHISKCRKGGAPLHAQLRTEAMALYDDLKAKARAREDADDDAVDATAVVEATEVDFENAIRDLDGDLEKYDRNHPEESARRTIFPEGFGAVIEPEGARQLEVLPSLHVRMQPWVDKPELSAGFAKVLAAEQALDAALAAEEAADKASATAFAVELSARAAVRAQLVSAHGQLRVLYKQRPSLAEAFFMKLGRKEGKPAKKPGGEGGGGEGGGGEGSGGGTPPAG